MKKLIIEDDGVRGRIEARLVSELEIVPLDELHIDHEHYQRAANRAKVAEIAGKFDIDVCGIITVNRRTNGLMYVVDGQHRVLAAAKAGHVELFAQVYQGLTRKDESWLFEQKNSTHGPMKALAQFKARLEYGDPVAKAMQKVAVGLGSKINDEGVANNASGINAVASCEWVFSEKGGGSKGLYEVLSLLNDSFGKLGGEGVHGEIIKGAYHFLCAHRSEYDRKKLVRKLALVGPEGLKSNAHDFRRLEGSGGYLNYYRAIRHAYNAGTKNADNRLDEKLRFEKGRGEVE